MARAPDKSERLPAVLARTARVGVVGDVWGGAEGEAFWAPSRSVPPAGGTHAFWWFLAKP